MKDDFDSYQLYDEDVEMLGKRWKIQSKYLLYYSLKKFF